MVGGRIGAFLFPLLFTTIGEVGVIVLLAAVALLGALATQFLVPETARISLETLNRDNHAELAAVAAE